MKKAYTEFDIRVIRMAAESDVLNASINVQTQKVEVDEYQAQPEENFIFELADFSLSD